MRESIRQHWGRLAQGDDGRMDDEMRSVVSKKAERRGELMGGMKASHADGDDRGRRDAHTGAGEQRTARVLRWRKIKSRRREGLAELKGAGMDG